MPDQTERVREIREQFTLFRHDPAGWHDDAITDLLLLVEQKDHATGAAKAVGIVIPELNGKLNGMALRVPLPTGSIVDLTVRLDKDPSVEELNNAMKTAAQNKLKGILEYCVDPIVSSDIVGNTYSSIYDSLATMKIGKGFFKVLSWYDNEWGYSNRVVDLMQKLV